MPVERIAAVVHSIDASRMPPAQRVKLAAVVAGQRRFMHRLYSRIQMLRFPEDDPLDVAAQQTRDAVQRLCYLVQKPGSIVMCSDGRSEIAYVERSLLSLRRP